ncbi:MAG: hypothetical protein ACI9QN_002643 [Arcticibacterium sp.]|jgi:hypothetical protein
MKNLGKKAKIILIISFFLEAFLFMYFMPFGSFNPNEIGFHLCVLYASISTLSFAWAFGNYLEYKRKNQK